MKTKVIRTILIALTLFFWLDVAGQGYKYVEASKLTLCGKILMNTANPYHRVDTASYKGFTAGENAQVRMSSGISVVFKTDSRDIVIKTEYGKVIWPDNTNGFSARGYDLYIRKDEKWLYAGSGTNDPKNPARGLKIVTDMGEGDKECLLYLPLYSEVNSVKIGVVTDSYIEPLENPFRYRIAVFGSSYTQGSCTTRSGMTYLAQLGRSTGLEFLSLGCGGNCRLQSYFADVLCDSEADAFEVERGAMADKMMAVALKKYKDVYFIEPDATSSNHDATVDGVHPDNYGYTLWAESIRQPILEILGRYDIK